MIGYTTEADLVAYGAARGVTITLADAAIYLTKAYDWLVSQRLTFDPLLPPDEIVQAQLAAGLIYAEGGDPLAPLGPRVTQEQVVGAVSVSYSDSGPLVPLYPFLMALIAPYKASGAGSASFGVQRG
jgi:hypothetical protein